VEVGFVSTGRFELGGSGIQCLPTFLMKSSELKMLWKLVKAGEDRPLTAADLALLLRIRFALQEYEAKTGHRHPEFMDFKLVNE